MVMIKDDDNFSGNEIKTNGEERIILYVVVVGFHHKKGPLIEYCYPSLPSTNGIEFSEGWKNLPSFAIPEGAHHYNIDTVYFHFYTGRSDLKSILYGISCYQQIDSKNVVNIDCEITRGTVQKAVCVLSTIPLFGHIEVHVSQWTQHYMEHGVLNDYSCFPLLFRNLNANLCIGLLHSHELYLERKIIFYSQLVSPTCTAILSLLSLFPHCLDEGLDELSKLSQLNVDQLCDIHSKNYTYKSIVYSESEHEIIGNSFKYCNFQLSLDEFEDLHKFGFPLHLFDKEYVCHPYLPLSCIDTLDKENIRGYLVGVSNALFKQKTHLADVLVDLESGHIEFHNADVKQMVHLSVADMRYADYLIQHVTQNLIIGTLRETWLRSHFWYYIIIMLRTSLLDNKNSELANFNSIFISNWKNTCNYKTWYGIVGSALFFLSPGHPFTGHLNLSDMRIFLPHAVPNLKQVVKLNNPIASTSKAMGNALGQAKNIISSWWNNIIHDNAENRKNIEEINTAENEL